MVANREDCCTQCGLDVHRMTWQPIATAPMNLEVLISDGRYVYSGICRYSGGEPNEDWVIGFTYGAPPVIRKPTHWMPLPDGPL